MPSLAGWPDDDDKLSFYFKSVSYTSNPADELIVTEIITNTQQY